MQTTITTLAVLTLGVGILQIGSSTKGVEQRLEKVLSSIEKLIKPPWHFWLPICISLFSLGVSVTAVIVAYLAWQQPNLPSPSINAPIVASSPSPTKLQPSPTSTPTPPK